MYTLSYVHGGVRWTGHAKYLEHAFYFKPKGIKKYPIPYMV